MIREIAWNGILFAIPREWEIARMGMRHLLIEQEGRPVVEIKWEKTRRHPSLRRQLQKLAAAQKSDDLETFAEAPLPPDWQNAVQGFEYLGFAWQGRRAHGRGAILFCPVCGHLTLIQFFNPESEGRVAVQVLSSFRDHQEDGWCRWSVYDIRAVTPEHFRLGAYRFDPGHYELVFETGGGSKVLLHRWAPASIFLRRRTLVQFALEQRLIKEPVSYALNTEEAVEGSRQMPPGGRWPRPWRAGHGWGWFRIWQVAEKNRILAVSAAGRRPVAQELLAEICTRYESL